MPSSKIATKIVSAFLSAIIKNYNPLPEYTLDEVKTFYQIEIPIDHSREAVEYAKKMMPFQDGLKYFKKINKMYQHRNIKWKVIAKIKDLPEDFRLFDLQDKNGIYNKKNYDHNAQQEKKYGQYWSVVFITRKVIPSFYWRIEFLKDGKLISNTHGCNK